MITMNNCIDIDERKIGPTCPPYLIAELSGNHNGDLNRALHLLELAKNSGASAVKIQTYTPDTMTIDCDRDDFKVSGGLWDGKSLYELYEWAHTPWEWHQALFDRARELGITLFSSPFDETAVDFLEDLGAPAYKIASFEMTDLPLVQKVALTGKPVIISTGMATFDEIEETVQVMRDCHNENLVLLHCVSSYPATHKEANLRTIPALRERFGTLVGLSDHTLTNATAVASVALGATVLEKHFIDTRASEGPDSAFSVEPEEFKVLTTECTQAWEALGEVKSAPTKSEQSSLAFRRSLYVVADVRKGEVLNESNLRRIRPGYGVAPKYFEHLLGKAAHRDFARGEPITTDDLSAILDSGQP